MFYELKRLLYEFLNITLQYSLIIYNAIYFMNISSILNYIFMLSISKT